MRGGEGFQNQGVPCSGSAIRLGIQGWEALGELYCRWKRCKNFQETLVRHHDRAAAVSCWIPTPTIVGGCPVLGRASDRCVTFEIAVVIAAAGFCEAIHQQAGGDGSDPMADDGW